MSVLVVRWLMRWAETIGRAQAAAWEHDGAQHSGDWAEY